MRLCALKFRQDFIALTGIDPFRHVTVAAACQAHFRTFCLQENDIAIISEHGYQPNRRTSLEATEWLEFLNDELGGAIRHGRNGKEKKIGKHFVDGIDELTKTIYEYNGCVFHGCPRCTQPEDTVPFSNLLMKNAFEQFEMKCDVLEKMGYSVEVMWSCDWKEKREEPEVAAFLSRLNLSKPLLPKDAFKGGRTNASVLFRSCGEGENGCFVLRRV